MDAANILKPALARGDLRSIGATTLDEYQKYFEVKNLYAKAYNLIWQNKKNDIADYIQEALLYDENLLSKNTTNTDEKIFNTAKSEYTELCEILSLLNTLTIKNAINKKFESIITDKDESLQIVNNQSLLMSFDELFEFYQKQGYGKFAKYNTFLFTKENGING